MTKEGGTLLQKHRNSKTGYENEEIPACVASGLFTWLLCRKRQTPAEPS
jgi:hypothetical protein